MGFISESKQAAKLATVNTKIDKYINGKLTLPKVLLTGSSEFDRMKKAVFNQAEFFNYDELKRKLEELITLDAKSELEAEKDKILLLAPKRVEKDIQSSFENRLAEVDKAKNEVIPAFLSAIKIMFDELNKEQKQVGKNTSNKVQKAIEEAV